MASFLGLKLRSVAERAYDRGQAEGELADIEVAEAEFLALVDRWPATHAGDRKAIGVLGDFLVDYFAERRRDAASALDLDDPDEFRGRREHKLDLLRAGGRL